MNLQRFSLVLAFFTAIFATGPIKAETLILVNFVINGKALDEYYDVMLLSEKLFINAQQFFSGVEGRYYAHQNHYQFQVGSQAFTLQPKPMTAGRGDMNEDGLWTENKIIKRNEELFIEQSLLEDWLNLDIYFSDDNLTLFIESERPLPIDRRLMRERRWARFLQPDLSIDSNHRPVTLPYALWGSPKGELRVSSVTSQTDSRTSLDGAFELEAGYLSNEFFLAANDDTGLNSFRWTAGRISPQGEAFGLANVYKVKFGDINGQRLPLTGGGGSGRGLLFSTAPLSRPSLFDVTQVQGDALPGWDVELYRSGNLIDFVTVGEDGRYEFNDVPLEFGNNEIKVLLYGPQGQIEERIFQQNINAGQLRPGDWQVNGSVLDRSARMIDVSDRQTIRGGGQLALRADYGLSRSLTAALFVDINRETRQSLRFLDELQKTDSQDSSTVTLTNVGLVLRPALGSITTEWVAVSQNEQEYALEGSTRFSALGLGLSAKIAHFSPGFISRQRRSSGAQFFDTKVNLRTGQSLGPLGSVNVNYERYELSRGGVREEWVPQWRHRLWGTRVSHELRLIDQDRFQRSQYRLLGSKRWGDWSSRFRLQAFGRSVEDLEINTLSISGDYRWDSQQSVGLTARYGVSAESVSVSGRVSSQWGPTRWSVSAAIDDAGSWSAGLSVSVGLGNWQNQPLALLPAQSTRGGALEVNVFQDTDGDGVFSENDQSVEGVRVAIDGRQGNDSSDEAGQLLALGLPTQRSVDVELDVDSLPDPFLTSSQPRVRFTPRPGFTHRINMPLQDSGFVTGEVRRSGQPISGLEVTAQRSDGFATESVLSLTGGYFAFERLAPGEWEIFIDAKTLPEGWQSTRVKINVEPGASLDGLLIDVSRPVDGDDGA